MHNESAKAAGLAWESDPQVRPSALELSRDPGVAGHAGVSLPRSCLLDIMARDATVTGWSRLRSLLIGDSARSELAC